MACTGAAVVSFFAMETRSPPPGDRYRYPTEVASDLSNEGIRPNTASTTGTTNAAQALERQRLRETHDSFNPLPAPSGQSLPHIPLILSRRFHAVRHASLRSDVRSARTYRL